MSLNITISVSDGEYDIEVPDNTKYFNFNIHSGEISLETHPPNHATVKPDDSRSHETENDDLSIMEVLEGADGAVFASAAYIAKNPIETAKKLAIMKRNSSAWYRYRKIANKYSCAIDLKDTDACDNAHLSSLLDYYVMKNDLIEDLLAKAGKKYGTTSRSHRLNYAAYEVIKRVRENGTSSYFNEKDFLKPLEERVLLNHAIVSSITTYSVHTRKFKWLHKMGLYFYGKLMSDLITDNRIKLLNETPDVFKDIMEEVMTYIISTEKRIGKDYDVVPQGIYESVARVFYQLLYENLKKLYPELTLNLSELTYDEYLTDNERLPGMNGIIKYKLAASNYARRDTIYRTVRKDLTLLPGVREYNVKGESIYDIGKSING